MTDVKADAKERLYGFWSSEAAGCLGCLVYKDAAGNDVKVTSVSKTKDPEKAGYGFDDAVCVGEVVRYAGGALFHPCA